MRSIPALLPLLLLLAFACTSPSKPGPPAPVDEANVVPEINTSYFEDSVAKIEQRLEGDGREIKQCLPAVVEALAFREGTRVADVGAGTGLLMGTIAAEVGPRGRVYALEIVPHLVEHLKERARAEGLDQVEVRQADVRGVGLPPGSIDQAVICDVYHHFEYPRTVLASLYEALDPGGRLCVLDFERIPGVSREWILGHVRAGKEVFRAEIEEMGFRFVEEVEVEGLEDNYLLVFERP